MVPPGNDAKRDMAVRRAFLLYERGQLDAALRLLASLPRGEDVDALRARIAADRGRAKSAQDHLRHLRCELHLNTTARRAGAYVLAAASTLYGTYETVRSSLYARQHGLAAYITTREWQDRRLVDYTRPIWHDLVYGSVLLVVGIAVALVVYRIARGAADWEELDVTGEPPAGRIIGI